LDAYHLEALGFSDEVVQALVNMGSGAVVETSPSSDGQPGSGVHIPAEGTFMSPFLSPRGRHRSHAGIDISGPRGSPIYATQSGEVIKNQWQSGYGWTVDIKSGDKVFRYAHLDEQPNLRVGQRIQGGQQFGKMGASGTRNPNVGFHLHTEVRTWESYKRDPFSRPDASGRHDPGILDPAQFYHLGPRWSHVNRETFGPPHEDDHHPIAGKASDIPYFNTGIRSSKGGFHHFRNEWGALAATARTISHYPERFGADTIRGIIGKYAPPKGNPTQTYIKHVAEWTGIDPDEHLDLNNKKTMAKLVAAIARQEGTLPKEKASPERIGRLLHRAAFGAHSHGEHHKHTAEVFIHDASGGLVTIAQ
jgi:murein DD-endopeptidase MepM/ murein hydrolase activator NlpD